MTSFPEVNNLETYSTKLESPSNFGICSIKIRHQFHLEPREQSLKKFVKTLNILR